MRWDRWIVAASLVGGLGRVVAAQEPAQPPAAPLPPDPIKTLVERLDLEKYKATIKGLTQFGDRRQGTDRNRAALDWIEAQLKSYGCTNTERINYTTRRLRIGPSARRAAPGSGGRGAADRGRAGSGRRRPRRGGRAEATVAERGRVPASTARRGWRGAARIRAARARTRSRPHPASARRCTARRSGSTHPEEMYIVGGHMDGHGWGEAANDDGSGTALVMELARVFSSPDVQTDRSIRFILWNNEETGLNGAGLTSNQRKDRCKAWKIRRDRGSIPEPKWLGMIQHDMMMWDHGMPRADGTVPAEQRREADVNIEFQMNVENGGGLAEARLVRSRQPTKSTRPTIPPASGPHMTNTDSTPFMNLVPAISLRENERGMQIGAGSDPNWHQPSDLFTTYTDNDFRLGLNAAQTTLGAVAQLTSAAVKK